MASPLLATTIDSSGCRSAQNPAYNPEPIEDTFLGHSSRSLIAVRHGWPLTAIAAGRNPPPWAETLETPDAVHGPPDDSKVTPN